MRSLQKTLKSLVRDIELGRVAVKPKLSVPLSKVANGVVQFCTDNGWQLFVFIDCGAWDYFDRIITPDKKKLTHKQVSEILTYRPTEKVARLRYGVAGYLKFDEDSVDV